LANSAQKLNLKKT